MKKIEFPQFLTNVGIEFPQFLSKGTIGTDFVHLILIINLSYGKC